MKVDGVIPFVAVYITILLDFHKKDASEILERLSEGWLTGRDCSYESNKMDQQSKSPVGRHP